MEWQGMGRAWAGQQQQEQTSKAKGCFPPFFSFPIMFILQCNQCSFSSTVGLRACMYAKASPKRVAVRVTIHDAHILTTVQNLHNHPSCPPKPGEADLFFFTLPPQSPHYAALVSAFFFSAYSSNAGRYLPTGRRHKGLPFPFSPRSRYEMYV